MSLHSRMALALWSLPSLVAYSHIDGRTTGPRGGLLIKNTVTYAIDRVEYASIWETQGLQTVRPPCRLSESRTCSDLFLVSFTRDTPIAGPKPGTVSTDTAHDLTLRARQLRESESAAHFSR